MVINAALLHLVITQSNLEGLGMKRVVSVGSCAHPQNWFLLAKSADFKHVVIISHHKLL